MLPTHDFGVGSGPGGPDGHAPDTDDGPRCSARGCRAAATTDLTWRNPRLHDTSRLKHWLACDEHADSLADYLAQRSFLLDRTPL